MMHGSEEHSFFFSKKNWARTGFNNATDRRTLMQRDSMALALATYVYGYDDANRLTAETLNGTPKNYAYDITNQLTSDGTSSYQYDPNGNRTNTGYATGTGNRLTSDGVWTYTYDDEGNQIKKTKGITQETWTYAYDHRNQLTRVEQRATDGGTLLLRVDYKYDVWGNRIEENKWKPATGNVITRFAYDGDHVWADLSGSNALQTRRFYLDGVDQVFARLSVAGVAAWYLTDRLGSIRDITNAAGAVQDHLDYDGFGNVTESNPTFGDRYKFTGREYDADLILYYYRARPFGPTIGRFLGEDSWGFAAGDPNLYRYVGNNPTNAVDPTGHDIVVLLERDASQGQGHTAILVGNDKTGWRYRSWSSGNNRPWSVPGQLTHEGDTNKGNPYKNLAQAQKDDKLKTYDEYMYFKASAKQDEAALDAADAYQGKAFILTSRNCCNMVVDAMKAAGFEFEVKTVTVNGAIPDAAKNMAGKFVGNVVKIGMRITPPSLDKLVGECVTIPSPNKTFDDSGNREKAIEIDSWKK